jgi:hypothetical protein
MVAVGRAEKGRRGVMQVAEGKVERFNKKIQERGTGEGLGRDQDSALGSAALQPPTIMPSPLRHTLSTQMNHQRTKKTGEGLDSFELWIRLMRSG